MRTHRKCRHKKTPIGALACLIQGAILGPACAGEPAAQVNRILTYESYVEQLTNKSLQTQVNTIATMNALEKTQQERVPKS